VNGAVEIFRIEAPLDIGIVAEGYRPVVLEAVSEDRVVELEPGLEVRLRLPEGLVVPAPKKLVANVWYSGPFEISGAGGVDFLPFDEHAELRLRVGGPGVVTVLLHVEHGPGRQGSVLVPGGIRQPKVSESSG